MKAFTLDALIARFAAKSTLTVDKAIKEWRKENILTASSLSTFKSDFTYIKAWARDQKLGESKLACVKPSDIAAWINAPGKTKIASRKRKFCSLKAFFKYWFRHRQLPFNPCEEVSVNHRLLSHAQKQPKIRQPFTDEEFARLIAYIHERWEYWRSENLGPRRQIPKLAFWYSAAVIGRATGLRLADIASLEWTCFEKEGVVSVWTGKSNTRVEIPIEPELAKVIATIPRTAPLLFPLQDSIIKYAEGSKLSAEFGRLVKRAGIVGKSFHSLRHSKLSSIVSNGGTIDDARRIAGHASESTTRGYLHEIKHPANSDGVVN